MNSSADVWCLMGRTIFCYLADHAFKRMHIQEPPQSYHYGNSWGFVCINLIKRSLIMVGLLTMKEVILLSTRKIFFLFFYRRVIIKDVMLTLNLSSKFHCFFKNFKKLSKRRIRSVTSSKPWRCLRLEVVRRRFVREVQLTVNSPQIIWWDDDRDKRLLFEIVCSRYMTMLFVVQMKRTKTQVIR